MNNINVLCHSHATASKAVYSPLSSTLSVSHFLSRKTGGGSGIGQAVVRRLVAEGGIVTAVDVNEDGLKAGAEQAEKIAAAGGRHSFMVGSVSCEESAKKIVQNVVDQEGRLDALINVAGILRSKKTTETSLEGTLFILDWIPSLQPKQRDRLFLSRCPSLALSLINPNPTPSFAPC